MPELFCDEGRVLVGALDHYPLGSQSGLERPLMVADRLIAGGVDAIIASFGILKSVIGSRPPSTEPPKFLLRADGNETYLHGEWTSSPHWCRWYSASDAHAIGASGLAVNLILGGPSELESLTVVSSAARDVHHQSLGLLVSVIVVDDQDSDRLIFDPERVMFGARVAAELGADIVNIYTNGDARLLADIPLHTFVPTVVSGLGPIRRESPGVASLRMAGELGFAGACLGRALWGSEAAEDATQIATQVVHSPCAHSQGTSGSSGETHVAEKPRRK